MGKLIENPGEKAEWSGNEGIAPRQSDFWWSSQSVTFSQNYNCDQFDVIWARKGEGMYLKEDSSKFTDVLGVVTEPPCQFVQLKKFYKNKYKALTNSPISPNRYSSISKPVYLIGPNIESYIFTKLLLLFFFSSFSFFSL